MNTVRVVGQPPKLRNSDGRYLRVAYDGEVVTKDQYVTIGQGGGFNHQEITHEFRIIGSIIRRISKGNPHCYAVTEVEIPK